MQPSLIEELVTRPGSEEARPVLEFFASTQEIFQFGFPAVSTSLWRKNLKYASSCFALHEATKTWRKVQVDAVDGDFVRLAFETGLEDRRWYNRNSLLLREEDLRTAWQIELRNEHSQRTCDVFVDGQWQELRVGKIFADDRIEFEQLPELHLSLATSPLLAEPNTRSGIKPRFCWRGERAPISLHAVRENTPLIVRETSMAFNKRGSDALLALVDALHEGDEDFAMLVGQCCGNGLLDEEDDAARLREIVQTVFAKLSPNKLRVVLPFLEVFMRRLHTADVFTEREIANLVEFGAIQVAVGLLGSELHGADAVQGLRTACEKIFMNASASTAYYDLTKQNLVVLLENGGAFTHGKFLEAVQFCLPEICKLVSDPIALVVQCAHLAVLPQLLGNGLDDENLADLCATCSSFELFLRAAPHVKDLQVILLALVASGRFSEQEARVQRVMESLFHKDPDGFADKARALLALCLEERALELAIAVADYVQLLRDEEDAALKLALQDACLPALFQCDRKNILQWTCWTKRQASEQDLDAFFVHAVEQVVARRFQSQAERGEEEEEELVGAHLQSLVDTGALRPISFAGMLASVKLRCELNMDVCLAPVLQHADFSAHELAKVVAKYGLYAQLLTALEDLLLCESDAQSLWDMIAAQLDVSDCTGTRGNRAHESLAIDPALQVTIEFSPAPSAGREDIAPEVGCKPVAEKLKPITIQARATIWDLKLLISNQFETTLLPQDILLLLRGKFYGDTRDNALLLADIRDGEEATNACIVFRLDRAPVEEALLKQRIPPVLSRKAEQALIAVFQDYCSIENVLSHDGFCEIYFVCTGKRMAPEQVYSLLGRMPYVENPELGMQLEEFLEMYALQCVKDANKVRSDLAQFGFDPHSLVKRGVEARLTFDFDPSFLREEENTAVTFRGEFVKSSKLYLALHKAASGTALAQSLLRRLPTDPHYLELALESNFAGKGSSAEDYDLLYLLQVYCSVFDKRVAGRDENVYALLEREFLKSETRMPHLLQLQLARALCLFQRINSAVAARSWDLYFQGDGDFSYLALFSASFAEKCLDAGQVAQWLTSSPKRLRLGFDALVSKLRDAPWLSNLLNGVQQAPQNLTVKAQAVLASLLLVQDDDLMASLLQEEDRDADFYTTRLLLHAAPLQFSPEFTALLYDKWQRAGNAQGELWLQIASTVSPLSFNALLQRDLLQSLEFMHEERARDQPCVAFQSQDAEALAKALCFAPFQPSSPLHPRFHYSKLKQYWVKQDEIAPRYGAEIQIRISLVCDACASESITTQACCNMACQMNQPSLQEQLDRLQQPERTNDACANCHRRGAMRRLTEYVAADADVLFLTLSPSEARRRFHLGRSPINFVGSSDWKIGAVLYTRAGAWLVCTEGKRFTFSMDGSGSMGQCEAVEWEDALDAIASDALVEIRGVTLVRNQQEEGAAAAAAAAARNNADYQRVEQENALLDKVYGMLKQTGAIASEQAGFLYALRFPQHECARAFTTSMRELMETNVLVWQRVCRAEPFLFSHLLEEDVRYIFTRCFAEHLFHICCKLIGQFPALSLTRNLPLQNLFLDQARFELEALYLAALSNKEERDMLIRGRHVQFLHQVREENFEQACALAQCWPERMELVDAALQRFFFDGSHSSSSSLLLLLQLVEPLLDVESTLIDAMQQGAGQAAQVELAIRFIIRTRVRIHSQNKLTWIQSFMLQHELFTLASEWMEAFPPNSALQFAQICFFLPEFEFRSATLALLELNPAFQLAWLGQLRANRREEQLRVLMGLITVLQQSANSLFTLVKQLLTLPVPQDEDRVTDWVVRFLQRCPRELPEFAHMAMEALEAWIEKVDNEIDVYSNRPVCFPREPANVLIHVAMANKMEEHVIEHVMLQVLDCQREYLVFWGVNERRETVQLRLRFETTGFEAFALPEDLEVIKRLLPGQSAVVFAAQRQGEDWGRFLFNWEFCLEEEEAGATLFANGELNHSRESLTFVQDDGQASPILALQTEDFFFQEEENGTAFASGEGEPDFMFEDDGGLSSVLPLRMQQQQDFSAILPAFTNHEQQQEEGEQGSVLLFGGGSLPPGQEDGAFFDDGGGGNDPDETWMINGEDPFEEEYEG